MGSISGEDSGFFNWPNPSSRNMAFGSTYPLTEMSTRNFPGDKDRPVRKAENLTAICEPIVYKMWEPRCLTTLWASTAWGIASPFILFLEKESTFESNQLFQQTENVSAVNFHLKMSTCFPNHQNLFYVFVRFIVFCKFENLCYFMHI
jgi:hypothetical protein